MLLGVFRQSILITFDCKKQMIKLRCPLTSFGRFQLLLNLAKVSSRYQRVELQSYVMSSCISGEDYNLRVCSRDGWPSWSSSDCPLTPGQRLWLYAMTSFGQLMSASVDSVFCPCSFTDVVFSTAVVHRVKLLRNVMTPEPAPSVDQRQ